MRWLGNLLAFLGGAGIVGGIGWLAAKSQRDRDRRRRDRGRGTR